MRYVLFLCITVSSLLLSLVGCGDSGTTGPSNNELLHNPVLSDMVEPQITVPGSCGLPNMSTVKYQANYEDPDGGVTSDIWVQVDLVWSTGASLSYISEPIHNSITGDGYSGTAIAYNCLAFGEADWVDVTLTIRDAAGHESNSVTARIYNPGNVP